MALQEVSPQNQGVGNAISDEELARATLYGFLAQLLSRSPDAETLKLIAGTGRSEGDVGSALGGLGEAARSATVAQVTEEYQNLFIGLGRGELVPYGSYYLTGFLQEKPLAKLRRDMATLGLKAKVDCRDPEDHVASVLEIMAGLIDGRFGGQLDEAGQRSFFDAHVSAWMPVFFRDLESAKTAQFYRAVGHLGRVFLEVESAQFQMAA